ncbi:MAG: carboxymuconolactone decarboxylase family protein [Candidatus Thorarchaeota archaeon]|jgi:AhpD family alkylhydroperoxidase
MSKREITSPHPELVDVNVLINITSGSNGSTRRFGRAVEEEHTVVVDESEYEYNLLTRAAMNMSKTCEIKKYEIKIATEIGIMTKGAFTSVVDESTAEGKVRVIYDDIKKTIGIDFVPNMYKAMALNPDYLESTWNRIQAIMGEEGKLDKKTKDIIALTVSIMSGCTYCIDVYNDAVANNGLDDEAITEIYAIIDIYSGLNRFNIAQGTKKDEKPWYGCGAK